MANKPESAAQVQHQAMPSENTMHQLNWSEIREALTSAIRDALPLEVQKTAGDRISGIGLEVDAFYGSASLYLLPESAARDLSPEERDNLGDWPISTWESESDYAPAFAAHWGVWETWFYDHVDDFDDDESVAKGRALLQAGCEAMQAIESEGLLDSLPQSEGFKIIIADHDEPRHLSLERYELFVKTGTIKGEWNEAY
ncbi:MAG: hypothetical protein JNG89_18280 [Planctomycetaceae bacterium]|nr:hypothetical protein [Planctomycetaceae bacterium]